DALSAFSCGGGSILTRPAWREVHIEEEEGRIRNNNGTDGWIGTNSKSKKILSCYKRGEGSWHSTNELTNPAKLV
ncbi:unnamed protein product, partial [Ilex paraguariensis]